MKKVLKSDEESVCWTVDSLRETQFQTKFGEAHQAHTANAVQVGHVMALAKKRANDLEARPSIAAEVAGTPKAPDGMIAIEKAREAMEEEAQRTVRMIREKDESHRRERSLDRARLQQSESACDDLREQLRDKGRELNFSKVPATPPSRSCRLRRRTLRSGKNGTRVARASRTMSRSPFHPSEHQAAPAA